MKFLVIGLGSMGKRRIRCLKYLGYENIIGFGICEMQFFLVCVNAVPETSRPDLEKISLMFKI